MTEEKELRKTLTEQVVDELLSTIKRKKEIDDEILENIRILAKEGGLKKPEQLIKVIKPIKGDKQ